MTIRSVGTHTKEGRTGRLWMANPVLWVKPPVAFLPVSLAALSGSALTVCLQLWAWAKGWWAWQWPGAKLPVAMSPESLIKSLSIYTPDLYPVNLKYQRKGVREWSEATQDLESCCKHPSWPHPWCAAERHLDLLLPAPLRSIVLAQTHCLISEITVIKKKKINDHFKRFSLKKTKNKTGWSKILFI